VLEQAGIPAWDDVIHTTWQTERVLPWTHLQGALTPEVLAGHAASSLAGQIDQR
jgi:hypothetical protein